MEGFDEMRKEAGMPNATPEELGQHLKASVSEWAFSEAISAFLLL